MYVSCVGAIIETERTSVTEVLLVSLLINFYAVAVVIVLVVVVVVVSVG
jgi:hypothetical protein